MLKRLLILLALLVPGVAHAQIVTTDALIYNTGSCAWQSGTGSPEGAQTANVCSYWIQTDAPYDLWKKTTGSGNTGWTKVSTGGTVTSVGVTVPSLLLGTGCTITTSGTCAITWNATANRIPYFSGATTLAVSDNFTYDGTLMQVLTSPAPSASSLNLARFRNSGGGTFIYVGNDAGITTGTIAVYSSLLTPVGSARASGVRVSGGGTGGLTLAGVGATSDVYIHARNNSTPSVTFGAAAAAAFGGAVSTQALTATSVTNSALTSGRLTFASTGGLLVDDADLTFATDILSATKVQSSGWMQSPFLYGNGTPNSLGLGGTGLTGCTVNPPTTINCDAASILFNSTVLEQRLVTNPTYRSRWNVQEDRTLLSSFSTTAFRPLSLEGAPVQVRGGGLHIGGTASVANPGLGNSYIEGWMRSVNPAYSSQTSGLAIDFSNGSIDAAYMYTKELHAKEFIVDLSTALNGSQTISKSVAIIAAAFTVPAPGSVSTLTLEDFPGQSNTAVFQSGDDVRLRQFSRAGGGLSITDAYGKVTGYADGAVDGTQTWTFTRSLSPCSGAMSTGATIEAKSLALDYGVPGNGFVETNAIDGTYGVNSPYIKVVTRGTCASDQTTQVKLGNLYGDTGVAEFGLLAGPYSSGQYIIMSNGRAEIHGVPLSLYSGVNRTLYMNPTLSSFAQASTNADTLTYSTGVGCWSGLDAGVFKWRCGDMAGDFITWNGTTLNVNGNITVTGLIAEDTLAVDGTPAADVASGAARALVGFDSDGNPALPANVAVSGPGLYLGANYMGYHNGTVWATFMDNNGNFYLGGVGGYLTWVANTSTLTISATLSGNGSGITSITGGNITTGSVTATQIQAGTITATQIAADTITAGNIAANAITTSELNADSVTSAKIVAGTIVASDIAAGTITANEIAAGTITASLIAAGTITATQIASATITATQIQSGTITGTLIAGSTITAGNIAAGTITTTQIAAGTITASNIAAGTITATELAANSVTTAKLDAFAVVAGKIDAGAVTTAKLAAEAVTADKIETNSITATQIAANAITASEIDTDAVTSGKIAAGAITADKIGAGEITADKLDVSDLSAISADLGTVTAGSITGVTISGATITAGAGAVILDADGLTILDWNNDDRNALKWSGGAKIFGYSDTLAFRSPDGNNWINIYNGSGTGGNIGVELDGDVSAPGLYLDALQGGGTKIVCADNNGYVSYGCAESRISALENEVKSLREMLMILLGEKNGNPDPVLRPAVLPGRKN